MQHRQRRLPAETPWQLTILVIAFALRCVALHHFWGDLNTDPDIYLGLARQMASGKGFSEVGGEAPTAFRPPLYPLLLTPVCGEDQQWGRAALHLILSTITFLGIWRIGRNLSLTPVQLGLASLLYAFDPLSVRYVALPMTETVCATLVTLLLVCLTESSSGRSSSLLTGLAFGLAVLSRPTFWIFGIVYFPIWLWTESKSLRADPTSGSPGHSLIPRIGYASIGILVCVLPWVIRNAIVMKSPIVMTTHGGYTLLLGNNEAFYREVVNQPWGTIWDGTHGPGQEVWYQQVKQEAEQEGITGEIAMDRWMAKKAQKAILEHPVDFLKACFLKFCWFWNLGPQAQGPEAHSLPPALLWAIRSGYLLFWSLGVIGLLKCLQALWRKAPNARLWLAPIIMVGSLSFAHLVYWSDARMRTPVTPAIALIAANSLAFWPRKTASHH